MSHNKEVIAKVNSYFEKISIPIIFPEALDLKDIFYSALENIWNNVELIKKRYKYAKDIAQMFVDFYGKTNTESFLDEVTDKLETENPGKDDIVDIYQWTLEEYENNLEFFIANQDINITNLEIIAEKLISIVKMSSNNIISYISVSNQKVKQQVVHGINSTIFALIGGLKLGFSDEVLKDLGIAGLLHDIGMLLVPSELIEKEDELSKEEYDVIKTHTNSAYKILMKKDNINRNILEAVVQHHEQFDGKGYPRKLDGDRINEFAKILAVADAFEAQISHRTYRKSKNGYSAIKNVLAYAKNKFDPAVLRAFLQAITIYPPGTLVQLSNNAVGLVDSVRHEAPLRPIVRIIIDGDGKKYQEKYLVDLTELKEVYVREVLDKEKYKKR